MNYTPTVLLTRPKNSSEEFNRILADAEIKVLHVPFIEIFPPDSWEQADEALHALSVYSGVVFTSVNGVRSFMERATTLEIPFEEIPPAYVVGTKTAEALHEYNITPVTINSQGGAGELIASMGKIDNRFFLHPTTNIATKDLAEAVHERGGKLNAVPVYKTVQATAKEIQALDEMLLEGEIDCIAFFSPSAVLNFTRSIPAFKQATVLVATIGQTTAAAAAAAGLRVDVIAPTQTAEALAHAIAERLQGDERIDFNPGDITEGV